ncbi:MAG: AMP-binding protein [Ignavibacteriales bacterium]|nr:AMP-binding protein [Ignavibacteriales bacterium]MCB9211328.1 AMP-binding protein [Ignavibacteriales bacterium]MCB9259274.1 AMP-binding protein [Ignavibacteriales bacterium]
MKHKLKLHKVPKIESIQEMVFNSAEVYKEKLAMEDLQEYPIKKVTYSELKENIIKFGKALKNLNLPERTHISLIAENRVQWSISYLTLMSFNYVIVPIDKNLTESEILNIVHESDSEAIIFSENFSNVFAENKSLLKRIKYFINMDKESESDDFLSMKKLIDKQEIGDTTILPKINPNDLAEIIFTSGSLGRAKGVMLSQKNLATNLMDMVSMLMMYPTDRFLSVLPIHHTYECTCGMLCPIYSGSSIHYARSLKTVAEDMQKVKATIVLGVPLLFDKMFKKVMKAINDDKKKSFLVPKLIKLTNVTQKLGIKDLKKKIFKELQEKFGGAIRIFIVGGAAADPIVAEGLQGFGFAFLQGYGLTETSPILTVNQIDNFKNDAAGLPLPSVELKIVNPDENGIGEIYAKGDNVMLGYYKNEEQTKETFDESWFKTGDLGYIDKDGFLHIAGRKKNVIISKSGKNVFPEEIEDQLNHSPYIQESLVYGEKNDKHDEIIAAQIVVDAEAFLLLSQEKDIKINDDLVHDTISQEIDRVNKNLTSYKKIVRFYIREHEFEKTTTQKIKRYLVS